MQGLQIESDMASEPESENARQRQLRLKPAHDIIILREVLAVNPFIHRSGWAEIAETLSGDSRMPGKLSPRCLKDRTLRILAYYKKEDNAALRRFGTAEEYGEREQLLAEVLEMSEDHESLTPQPSTAAAERDKLLQEGQRIRRAALHRLQSDSSFDAGDTDGPSPSAAVDDDIDEEEAAAVSTPVKRLKVPTSTVRAGIYEYMVGANERSKEELELRRMQIENERKRLELEERRMNEERDRRREEMEERRQEMEARRQRDAEAAADRRQLLELVQMCLSSMQK